jgi:hypothetical protein
MSFMSWIHERADVQKASYLSNSVQVILEAAPWFAEKVRKRVKTSVENLKQTTRISEEEKSRGRKLLFLDGVTDLNET